VQKYCIFLTGDATHLVCLCHLAERTITSLCQPWQSNNRPQCELSMTYKQDQVTTNLDILSMRLDNYFPRVLRILLVLRKFIKVVCDDTTQVLSAVKLTRTFLLMQNYSELFVNLRKNETTVLKLIHQSVYHVLFSTFFIFLMSYHKL